MRTETMKFRISPRTGRVCMFMIVPHYISQHNNTRQYIVLPMYVCRPQVHAQGDEMVRMDIGTV